MSATEIVTVAASGGRWTAWKRVQVQAALSSACRTFSLTAAAEFGGAQIADVFALFAPVRVYAGGDLVIDGYVDRRNPHLGRGEITITGSTKGSDAVDCAAMHKTGRFENKTPLEIARELDAFGIGFNSEAKLDKIKEWQVQQGETVHRAVERLCREQGLTPTGKADGSIELYKADKARRHAGGLFEGVNMLPESSASFDGENRHSHVHARGQKYDGHGKGSLEVEGVGRDKGVTRYRPTIALMDGDATKERAKGYAKNRAARAAGKGIKASIAVVGWRDEAGQLWEPGRLVWTESPFLGLAQDMLIESISLSQGNGEGEGTRAVLSLVDPRAHGGKAGKRNKSVKAWAVEAEDE